MPAAPPRPDAALRLLRASLTPWGFLASPAPRADEPQSNYRRVWARDGVVCGIAALASGDADLARGLGDTLQTLAAHTGPQDQIPSNVQVDAAGRAKAVSYGGLAGRVDAGAWFVLGAALWARHAGGDPEPLTPAAEAALGLLDAWEFNARGLVYTPQSGNWADESDLHGYTLVDQALRIAALRAWAPYGGAHHAARADRLAALVEATFWPQAGADADAAYHPEAYRRAIAAGAAPHPFAALTPGGYVRRFDAWGTALALGAADLWPDRATEALAHGDALASDTPAGLVPAFWPTVEPGNAAWDALAANYRTVFSNHPGHYHNGGLWPVVAGWWAVARAAHGLDPAPAAAAIHRANDADGPDPFPEYLDAAAGRPHGQRRLAWSAAGEVLAAAGAETARLLARPASPAMPPPLLAARAADARVVVAGEALVDLLSTETAGALDDAHRFERHAGGSAANFATNLARLGVPTALVATVGDDGFGRFLAASAARTGAEARLRVAEGSPTSVAIVTRSTGTPDYALFRHADRLIEPAQLPQTLLAGARLFHTSGFALGREPARTTLLGAAARAAAAGTPLSADLNVSPRTPAERAEQLAAVQALLGLGPLVKASRDDVGRLFGAPLGAADAAARLRAWGARLVCLTRGADSTLVVWADADGRELTAEVEAAPVERIADATGAGDAFWAGFVAAWLAGVAPPACAEAGGRLAARKLATAGPLPDALDAADVLGVAVAG